VFAPFVGDIIVSLPPAFSDRAPPAAASDLLIIHATIITGAFLPVIKDGAVLIRAGKILATGESQQLSNLYSKNPNTKTMNARGYIIIPGLFNTHTHVALGFFRGLGHGKSNMIESFLFPAEKSLTPELLEPLSYSYIYDGLRAGVTSFVDHYYFSEGIGRAFEKFGVRGWIGETVADLGGAFSGRESWERAKGLIENSSFGPLIRHVVSPHAADTVSPELLKDCADYAKANRLTLHMHLSQTQGEFNRVGARDQLTPVEAAHNAGALGPRSLVVHLTSATTSDLRIIKDSGATIGYCPTSTLLYDRLADIKTMHALNIPMAIGTDCAASHDSADSLGEIKTAGLFGRNQGVDVSKLSPDHLLAMATIIPAAVLGAENELGTIEPGKLADLVFLKVTLSAQPIENPLANVIYSMGARDVSHVMTNGQWTLWNKELPSLDHDELSAKYLTAVTEISRRIDLSKNLRQGTTTP
jgi:5-methylthioadenosine/S-adenosylhomocysteine deaminase